ncbi:MAG: metallophosphoesterase, partial [Armatimonadota bacterium]
MGRKLVLLIVALALTGTVAAVAEQAWPKTPPAPAGAVDAPFSFVVLGDNRPGGAGSPVPPVYIAALQSINATTAQFVINTGDIISGSTDLTVMNQQLDDFIAATEVLGVPCYVAYGNHELRSAECLQVLEQRIGPSYCAFSHGNSRVYVL